MIKTLLLWAYKLIEIIAVVIIGYLAYLLIATFASVVIAQLFTFGLGYFFGNLLKPYMKELQDYIYKILFRN